MPRTITISLPVADLNVSKAFYTACGFVRVPLLPFTAWVLLAVSLWTAGLYGLSVAIGQTLARHLGLPPPVAVALPIVVLALAVPVWRWARQRRLPCCHRWRARPVPPGWWPARTATRSAGRCCRWRATRCAASATTPT